MPATFDPKISEATLFSALLAAARTYGSRRPALEDAERQPITFERLVLGSLVLGAKITKGTRAGETVGVLLPNVNAMAVTLFGLNAYGRVAALLNFTAGPRNLASAVRTARISRVITSRRFIEHAKLEDTLAAIEAVETAGGQRVEIVLLEDVRRAIGTIDKIKGAAASLLAGAYHRRQGMRPDSPAVVLFTSGTEGDPKGVVLTNRSLVANARQIHLHAENVLGANDVMLNPLPMFHAYGLTAGLLMPLLKGMKVVLYPSPLHYRQIPKLIAETRATMMVATDTFLQGYARAAEAGDLASVRFVVAGAERVKDTTRAMWDKWGTILLEGYGATECAPVIAVNLPEGNRPGTVGTILPGIEHRIESVEGITVGGRLLVRGPNVMAGYMLAARPGEIVPPPDGWHDTGDIVTIDGDGFVTIRGRAKRFAKIGGEMVSLAAVEGIISGLWPDCNHVVVSLPDARKGEQLVLVTEQPNADKDALLRHSKAAGLPELWVPRAVLVVGSIPVMGTGKVDLPATTELARQARPLL